jgi:hypothetical protein
VTIFHLYSEVRVWLIWQEMSCYVK